MTMFNGIIGVDHVTFFNPKDKKTVTARKGSHPNYDAIVNAIKAKQYDLLPDLIDIPKAVSNYGKGKIVVRNGEIYYGNEQISNYLSERILQMMNEGFEVGPMIKFLENLMDNPSHTSVKELYLFLEKANMPITEDGHFLAYKKVRNDYKDIHSGKFDNSVGAKPEMPRNMVDDDRSKTCSSGLHFCAYEYLPHFGSASGNRVMLVKVNPADVVSIPNDYANAKGRAWRYEVIDEVTDRVAQFEEEKKPVFVHRNTVDTAIIDKQVKLRSVSDVANYFGCSRSAARKRIARGSSVAKRVDSNGETYYVVL